MTTSYGFISKNDPGAIKGIELTRVGGTYTKPDTPTDANQLLFHIDSSNQPYLEKSDASLIALATTNYATFKDSVFRITGSADVTKIAAFEVDGFTTATTRTFTLPDASGGLLITTPNASTQNLISAPTATVRALALKTTDDNTTNNLLELLSSAGAVLGSFSAVGGATLPTAYIGASGGPVATELTVVTTSASDPRGIMSAQYSTDTNASRIHLRKARGTPAVPTTIVTGDILGRVRFSGYDGSNFLQMASIDAVSTGTVAATRIPTYLSFSVGTDAAPSVLTEVARLTITGLNNTVIGATTPAAGTFTTVAGTTGTFTNLVTVTRTTEQLRLAYDGSNYTSFTVSSSGNLTIASTGASTTTLTIGNGTNAQFSTDGRLALFGSSFSDVYSIFQSNANITIPGSATNRVLHNLSTTPTISTANQTGQLQIANIGATVALAGFTVATVRGLLSAITAAGSGTITTADVWTAQGTTSGTATITTLRNINIASASAAGGAITNVVGIAMAAQTASTNNTYLLIGTNTAVSGNWGIYSTTTNNNLIQGPLSLKNGTTTPTAFLHLGAGTTAASTAPIKLTTGTSMTTAEAGAVEFTTDDLFFTITTGTARKRLLMADAVGGLTSGRVPYVTTNGRLLDSANLTYDATTLTFGEGNNIAVGTATGTIIGTSTSQKLALWNKTPNVQPTNAITASAFVANTSGIANDTATFGGYTLGQIAAALIRIGALA